MKRKILAGLLAMSVAASLLTGCQGLLGSGGKEKEEVMVRTNETISPDSKWIDSEIDGAIDESTETDPTQDFYTYVNKDWILSTEVSNDSYQTMSRSKMLGSNDDVLKQQLTCILNGQEDPDADGDVELPAEEISHDQELVMTFANAAGDWEKRNSEGVEPLRKYVDNILNISSMEEMTDYILDTDQQNLFDSTLISVSVRALPMDAQNYRVFIDSGVPLSLDESCYTEKGTASRKDIRMMKERYGYILDRLGYSQQEIEKIFRSCYRFEAGIVDHEGAAGYYSTEWINSKASLVTTSREDIKKLAGDYPLDEILTVCGYDTDMNCVMNPGYVRYIASIYNEAHLEQIKNYLLIRTIGKVSNLLDRETLDEFNLSDDADDIQNKEDDDAAVISVTQKYLGGALDNVYISRYCRQEEKEDLTNLTNQIIDYYHEMLEGEDWLSEKARKGAIEKLDNMGVNILYPDKFASYSYLDFGDDTELLDLVADISYCRRGQDAGKLGTTVDRNAWDEENYPTVTNNCFYIANQNSFNIMAGYVAGDLYDIDMSTEEKFAYIGTTIGHEITHGFDTNGCEYDKYGNRNLWWDVIDVSNFALRAQNLKTYYSAITPYPGAKKISGDKVSTEAIADMGGMKCVLGIAKGINGFDYKKFFECYAELWAEKDTYRYEELVSTDEHPLNFLRVNVTPMQFDEFYETFGIEKGDGMYLAPKERIAVW